MAGLHWLVRNDSHLVWESHESNQSLVALAAYFNDSYAGTAMLRNGPVSPGQNGLFYCALRMPASDGPISLRVRVVHHNHAFFDDHGGPIHVKEVALREHPDPEAETEVADLLASNYAHFLPAGGVLLRRDGGRWPITAYRGSGARLYVDSNHKGLIDYLMGWGSALLGYEPSVLADIQLPGAPTLSLPHICEHKVAVQLRQLFPEFQMVQFGKNGSDVCTLSARMARIKTGRRVLLYCGYHGWQDWYAQRGGFADTGIPGSGEMLLRLFSYGDAAGLEHVFSEFDGQVAGVILEPAGGVLGPEGPIPEVDAPFLSKVRECCDRYGSLLIFDEIFTGFRHPRLSVARDANVTPDILLLGKGLAAGYPLGALLTSREIFTATAPHVAYGPTYKGELSGLAAAARALEFYLSTDVPANIRSFGTSLRERVLELPQAAALRLDFVGPVYRQMAVFPGRPADQRLVLRSLLSQELLRRGVLTYKGLFLPSYAHGEVELEETVQAFAGALDAILQAANPVNLLELPPPQ